MPHTCPPWSESFHLLWHAGLELHPPSTAWLVCLGLRVIFWARRLIWIFFSFMISIWFCYGFVMVSIWWKIWFCYGFKVLYQRDMIFNMIFVWCETASAKQNCECQSTQMWNKQTPICSFEKKTYTLFKVETRQKLKRKNVSKSDIWSCFRDSGRYGADILNVFPIWHISGRI